MTRRRRLLVAAAGAVGALFLLALVAVALAPRWIRLEPVRKKVESAASAALGGDVTIGQIDLAWFPRPGIVIRQVTLSVPGKERASFRSVHVAPAVRPLLRGRFRLSSLRVEGADLTVELPEGQEGERPSSGRAPSPGLTPLLASLTSGVPGVTVEATAGRFSIERAGKALAVVEDLDVRVGLASKGSGAVHADVKAAASSLSLTRPGRPGLAVEGTRVEAGIDLAAGKTDVALSRLSVDSPHFFVEGALHVDTSVPRAEATARGSGLDVTALRGKLLPFAGDDPTVRDIFAIFRHGTLTSFTFASGGGTPADLGVFERMSIHAVLADGGVHIESAGLDLEEATGDVAVATGVLTAEHAAARIGRSRARDGSVRVGLGAGDDTLRVEAEVQSDLAELPGILGRAVKGRSFHEELARIGNLTGSATARLTLENRAGGLRTNVAVSALRLSADYRRLPWPIRIRDGGFSFDGERIGVSRLAGTLGSSSFSGLTARLRLGGEPAFEEVSGDLTGSLEELFPWLSSRQGLEALGTEVRELRGAVSVSVNRLSGPLSRPKEWDYEATGTLQDLVLDVAFLPKPLDLGRGGFRIDPGTIRITDLEARTMDADLKVSGSLEGYRDGTPRIEATADGAIGPEAVHWSWKRASLPADFRPVAPLAIREVRVGLPGAGAYTVAGTIGLRDGIRVDLDVAGDGGGTDFRRVAIADTSSDAVISLRSRGDVMSASFEGRLGAPTVENLFAKKRERSGRIDGNLHVALPRAHPGETTASGALLVTDFDVPTPAGQVTVRRLDLRAEKSRLDVVSSDVLLDGRRFSVSGSATFRDEGLLLDLDAKTDSLTWEAIGKASGNVVKKRAETEKRTDAHPAGGLAEKPSPLTILGDVRISIGTFGWGSREWAPVLADVRLSKDAVAIAVRKAAICGVSTTGEARLLPSGRMAVRAQVASEGPDVAVPLACFGLENLRMTGRYEISADVASEGTGTELMGSLRGPFSLHAWNGTIGKANVLTKILGALNATSVFSGKAPSFLEKAMSFSKIVNEGEFGKGRAEIREAALVTPSFTMAAQGTVGLEDGALDVTVLSHPFSTADRIIGFIPVLRYVLGGDFLSVAATVGGTVSKPEVQISAGKDAGRGVVNILERTVKFPVHVVTPKEKAPK